MMVRLKRWFVRVWGALSMAYMIGFALCLIAATLFSNMDRLWAACICAAIVVAGVACLRGMKRTYWGAGPSENARQAATDTADDAAETTDVVVMAPMRDEGLTLSQEALESLAGYREKEMWL